MTARQAGVRTLSVGGKGGTAAAATGAASKKSPAPTRQLLVARDIALQRMQKASLVQAIWRGLHARRRMRAGAAQLPPTRAEPGLEHVQLLVRVTAVRAVDDGGMMGEGWPSVTTRAAAAASRRRCSSGRATSLPSRSTPARWLDPPSAPTSCRRAGSRCRCRARPRRRRRPSAWPSTSSTVGARARRCARLST